MNARNAVFIAALIGGLTAIFDARAAESGDSVVVVYNDRMPESRKVAEHYAKARRVPPQQVLGLNLPKEEAISRRDFRKQLQEPLLEKFEDNKWFRFGSGKEKEKVIAASVRYVVLCYGVPLKITRDEGLRESDAERLQPELRRNEAAVDSDLALLPRAKEKLLLAGPLQNNVFAATNAAMFHPTNGMLMVCRLDGPTPEIASALVDKAMEAELNGFWGRAYFDARGLTNTSYKPGDDLIRTAAAISQRLGFETTLDLRPETFSAAFPMSHIALYAGWYDGDVSGPFARPVVEFMPGAFAYHLHSYNAATVRSASANWVGPLLAKGAAITFGTVDEPYLSGTPNVALFIERLLWSRLTFGEAAYAAQPVSSWQTTVVGDPLYRPFGEPPDRLHFRLEAIKHPAVEWSHLRVLNLNQAAGATRLEELFAYYSEIPQATNSAVLMEKLGDLHQANKQLGLAATTYAQAAKLKVSPMQRIRLLQRAGDLYDIIDRKAEAFEAFAQLVAMAPDFPSVPQLYPRLIKLGTALGKTNEVQKFEALVNPAPPR
jgi:uncharacterized protein (TIGR03790 family)